MDGKRAFTLYLTCVGRRIWKKWHDAGTKLQKQNVLTISSLRHILIQKIYFFRFLAIRGGQMEVLRVPYAASIDESGIASRE
jgi:hypothetical protein